MEKSEKKQFFFFVEAKIICTFTTLALVILSEEKGTGFRSQFRNCGCGGLDMHESILIHSESQIQS